MEKINIAKLLEDCPPGMELDSPMFENLEFDRIDKETGAYSIICRVKTEWGCYNTHTFTEYGCYSTEKYSKCVIFPKGKNTWEGFHRPFNDGDIIATDTGNWIGITAGGVSDESIEVYCILHVEQNNLRLYFDKPQKWYFSRLATKEEKEKLLYAIKANGYCWNSKTKSFDKLIEPQTPKKFYIRIGEIPSEERSAMYNGDNVIGYENGVSVYDCIEDNGLYHIIMPFPLKEGQGMTYEGLIQEITQCRYKIENPRNVYLVSGIEVGKGHDNEPLIKEVKILKDITEQFNIKNRETKTLPKLPKFKLNQKIKIGRGIIRIAQITENYYISEKGWMFDIKDQDTYELVSDKFDLSTLKPFESKVLIRDYNDKPWVPSFWGKYLNDDSNCRYLTTNGYYKYCIPYKGNEHLLDNTADCDNFYKTWE